MKTVRTLIAPILIVIGLCMLPGHASAIVCKGKTAVMYGSGMYNDLNDAAFALNAMKSKVLSSPQSYPYSTELEFYLAYADNGGATGPSSLAGLAQLYEAFVQKQAANDSFFWRWLGGIAGAPLWFKILMNDLAANTNASAYINDVTLQQQLDGDPSNPTLQPGYRALLKERDRVIVVAHSQGNFYANAAYDALVSQFPDAVNRLGIVAVASPDNRVAGGGQHISVPEDAVIAAIRLVYPITLPPSPTSGSSANLAELGQAAYESATYGHSFVQWYLAGSYTRNFITNAIVQTIGKLETPFVNWDKTIFTSTQLLIYPDTFADASRCVLDDMHHLGFRVSIIQDGFVGITAYPLSGTNTSTSSYSDTIPVVQQGLRQSIGILPIPSGVGIVYADIFEKGYYAFNNIADDVAVFGDTTVHLISYVWDPATGNWSKQMSQLALPEYSMSVQNAACPIGGAAACSGPLVFGDPIAHVAYYDPVVYKNGLYDFGGVLDLPGYQSKMVFGGYVNEALQGSWLTVSLNSGQLSVNSTGAFSLSQDPVGHIFSDPLTVGIPGYIRLHNYESYYLGDVGSDNVGITTQ